MPSRNFVDTDLTIIFSESTKSSKTDTLEFSKLTRLVLDCSGEPKDVNFVEINVKMIIGINT